jgi:hypothetical protein
VRTAILRAPTLTSALGKGATWKTALIPPGIALLGGIIVSIILTVILTSMSEFGSVTEETGLNLDSLNYALPFILMALSLFGSAALRLDINATDSFNAQLSIFMTGAPLVVTIVIVGLLWWMTKISERRSPAPNRVSTWIRIGVATLAMTLVLFLLQVIFAARATALEDEGSFTFSFSAVTARSFFLPLLVILITSIAGRVAGHFKGTEAIGAPFLRWAVPPLLVTWIHLIVSVGVFSIVALFVLPFSIDMPGQLVPLAFINMGLVLTSLSHFGGNQRLGAGRPRVLFRQLLREPHPVQPDRSGPAVAGSARGRGSGADLDLRRHGHPSPIVDRARTGQTAVVERLEAAPGLLPGVGASVASGHSDAGLDVRIGRGGHDLRRSRCRPCWGSAHWPGPSSSSPSGAGSSRCCPGRSAPDLCSPSRPSRGSPPAEPCTRTGVRIWG